MTYRAFFLNQNVDGKQIRLAEFLRESDAKEMETRAKFVYPDAEFSVDAGYLWSHEYDWAFFILWLFGFLLTLFGDMAFGYYNAFKVGAAAQLIGIVGARLAPTRKPISVTNVHELDVQ